MMGENLFSLQDADLKHVDKITLKQVKCSAWSGLPMKNAAKMQCTDVISLIGTNPHSHNSDLSQRQIDEVLARRPKC